MNLIDLLELPLSAYTPGRGDLKMEGRFETATGAPMYTYEMWKRDPGSVPYVTAASSNKQLFGKTVFRTIGDEVVPLKITDYGPKVKGLDIAFENPKYATNFPFQGQRDATSPTPTSRTMVASSGTRPQMSTVLDYLETKSEPTTGDAIASVLARLGQTFASRPQFRFNFEPVRFNRFEIPEAPRLTPFIT